MKLIIIHAPLSWATRLSFWLRFSLSATDARPNRKYVFMTTAELKVIQRARKVRSSYPLCSSTFSLHVNLICNKQSSVNLTILLSKNLMKAAVKNQQKKVFNENILIISVGDTIISDFKICVCSIDAALFFLFCAGFTGRKWKFRA